MRQVGRGGGSGWNLFSDCLFSKSSAKRVEKEALRRLQREEVCCNGPGNCSTILGFHEGPTKVLNLK